MALGHRYIWFTPLLPARLVANFSCCYYEPLVVVACRGCGIQTFSEKMKIFNLHEKCLRIHAPAQTFLNVDLEIVSTAKLDALVEEMAKRVAVLYSGPAAIPKHHLLVLESSRNLKNPDTVIHALCSVIEGLSPTAQCIWRKARKDFDVGYESRPSERALRFSLRSDTLQRVAALGATLTVTCYRDDNNA